jgi:aerobic-type carbon monoxide dehydrogenase small subunit (CoxS/CutS family)
MNTKPKNPMDKFFFLVPKDPIGKASFDYYMCWVLFVAFASLMINYIRLFIQTSQISMVMWAFVMFAVTYFSYCNLMNMYNLKQMVTQNYKPEKVENIKEMMGGFKK